MNGPQDQQLPKNALRADTRTSSGSQNSRTPDTRPHSSDADWQATMSSSFVSDQPMNLSGRIKHDEQGVHLQMFGDVATTHSCVAPSHGQLSFALPNKRQYRSRHLLAQGHPVSIACLTKSIAEPGNLRYKKTFRATHQEHTIHEPAK